MNDTEMASPAMEGLAICAFDLHFHLPHLWSASLLKREFGLLGERTSYAAAHRREGLPAPEQFAVAPLGRRLHDSHFWRSYSLLLPTLPGHASPSPWERHLPLVFSPRLDLEYAPDQVQVRQLKPAIAAKLFVWPYAWSTHLTMSLSGCSGLGRQQVQDLQGEVRSGSPFRFDAKEQSLTDVFRRLSGQLIGAVFAKKVQDDRAFERQFLIAVRWPEGAGRAAVQSGWNDDWAYRLLTPAADREQEGGGRSRTKLKGQDFALTRFKFGTVASVSRRPRKESAPRCLVTNLRDVLIVMQALLHLQQRAASYRGVSPELDGLAQTARQVLLALPGAYKNPLCEVYLGNHDLAKKFGVAPPPPDSATAQPADGGAKPGPS